MIDLRRGDVVLVGFPFVRAGEVHRKRRPALIVQADRYNRRRGVLILAAITSSGTAAALPAKVSVPMASPEGRRAGLRTDSVIDCQTLVTIPASEIAARLGALSRSAMDRVDRALADSLGLGPPAEGP